MKSVFFFENNNKNQKVILEIKNGSKVKFK